jgi:hypothetical protein
MAWRWPAAGYPDDGMGFALCATFFGAVRGAQGIRIDVVPVLLGKRGIVEKEHSRDVVAGAFYIGAPRAEASTIYNHREGR